MSRFEVDAEICPVRSCSVRSITGLHYNLFVLSGVAEMCPPPRRCGGEEVAQDARGGAHLLIHLLLALVA